MDGAGANNVLSAETLELLDNGEEDEEFSPEELAEDGEVEEEEDEEEAEEEDNESGSDDALNGKKKRKKKKKKKTKRRGLHENPEVVVAFDDGKEGRELFTTAFAAAYELRDDGEATGEVRIVAEGEMKDVTPPRYACTGYGPVDQLCDEEKAALGCLLCSDCEDSPLGRDALDELDPPFPPGSAVPAATPSPGNRGLREELGGEA